MKTVLFSIEGMHCKSCEMLITDALEDLSVKKSKVDRNEGTVIVQFDEGKISTRKIRDKIETEGYKVFMQKITKDAT